MVGGMLLKEFVGGPVALETFRLVRILASFHYFGLSELQISYTIIRWLMFAGKFGVSCAFAVIWIYSAELFSTDVRSNAMAMGSMSGRIGGIVSPFINEFYQDCC